MRDVYSVDIVSDIVRSSRNLGKRDLIRDVEFESISSFIREYIDKFGEPRVVDGALLWCTEEGDSYFMSIYKNEEVFNVVDLSDII